VEIKTGSEIMLGRKKIVIIGAGTMGKIIISGILDSGNSAVESITATARTKQTASMVQKEFGINACTDNVEACKDADIVVLAVKPKEIGKVVKSISNDCNGGNSPLLISIAAGVSTGYIENILENDTPVIRAMPNTPCCIRKGMTTLCRGTHATDEHIQMARIIFETLGKCIELDEIHMDAVTGLSASGPAFIYLIMESLADGGVMVGLPRKVAMDLVIQTVMGAAQMMEITGRHPASLKDDVTTPAGCTISGILTLEDGKIRSVLARAVQIAATRAGELGK
jgi:pyrroline-5-carboxylate reductase